MSETINSLETDWIDEYEEEDSKYNDFYTERLPNIKLYYVYVNSLHTISNIREEKLELDDSNMISKEKILYIIKNNIIQDNIKYKLLSLLVYNIDLEPRHLKKYLESDNATVQSLKQPGEINNEFLYSLKTLEDISLKDSITLFHDINGIYFIFFEEKKKRTRKSVTKKIRMYPKNKNTTTNPNTNPNTNINTTTNPNSNPNLTNKKQITSSSISALTSPSSKHIKSINLRTAKKTRKRSYNNE